MSSGRSWSRDGIAYRISPVDERGDSGRAAGTQLEIKIRRPHGDRPDWNPDLHPRDRLGRFIETADRVRIGHGGATGTVVRPVDAHRVLVRRPNGSTSVVRSTQLTVLTGRRRTRRTGRVTQRWRRIGGPSRPRRQTDDRQRDDEEQGPPRGEPSARPVRPPRREPDRDREPEREREPERRDSARAPEPERQPRQAARPQQRRRTIHRQGSRAGLRRPTKPNRDLEGRMVALHDGQGGWYAGRLHRTPGGVWAVVDDDPDHPDSEPVELVDTDYVDPLNPGDPRVGEVTDYEVLPDEFVEPELQRLEQILDQLWRRGYRPGHHVFDGWSAQHQSLAEMAEHRGWPNPGPPQVEQLPFDDPDGANLPGGGTGGAGRAGGTGRRERPARPTPAAPATEATRERMRQAADATEPGNAPMAELIRQMAADPGLLSNRDGTLVAVKRGNRYRILHAPSGRWVSEHGARNKPELAAQMAAIAAVPDPDGRPYDWNDPELPRRIADEPRARGERFNDRIREAEAAAARSLGRELPVDPEEAARRDRERLETEFRDQRLDQARQIGFEPSQARDITPGDDVEFMATVRWRGGELYADDGTYLGTGSSLGVTRDQLPDGSLIAVRGTVTDIKERSAPRDNWAGRTITDQYLELGNGAEWTSADGTTGRLHRARMATGNGRARVLHRAASARGVPEAEWEADRLRNAHEEGFRSRIAGGLVTGDVIALTGRVSRSDNGRLLLPGGIEAEGAPLREGDLVEMRARLGGTDWAGRRVTDVSWASADGRSGTLPDQTLRPFERRERVLVRREEGPDLPGGGTGTGPDRDGQPKIRPGISRSQRDAILDTGIEANPDYSEDERAAARLIRERADMTADELGALSRALRTHADSGAVKAARAGALRRTAHRLDATAAQLRGDVPDDALPEGATVERVTPDQLAEGDTVALPGPDGQVEIHTLTGVGTSHGGFTPLHFTNAAGKRERRLVPDSATVHRLPTLPPDRPVAPERTGREHISPSRVRVGDRLRIEPQYASGAPDRYDDREVVAVRHRPDGSAEATVRLPDGRTEEMELPADDEGAGSPTVVRLGRGADSADQPWDSVLPDEDPRPIDGGQARLGERIRVEDASGFFSTGTVTGLTRQNGAWLVRLRRDDGTTRHATIYDDQRQLSSRLVHLADPDENLAERIRQQNREREGRKHTKEIADDLADVASKLYRREANAGLLRAHTSLDRSLQEITGQPVSERLRTGAIRDMVAHLGVDPNDQSAYDAVSGRVRRIMDGFGEGVRETVVNAVRNARPLPGESDGDARERVLRQLRDQPPVDRDSYQVAARALAQLRLDMDEERQREAREGGDGPDPDAPQVPDLGEFDAALNRDPDALRTRMQAYQQALGGSGEAVGGRRVRRTSFADTTFEDLDNGKVPSIETREVWQPDVAADDGPGEHAMAQLQVLRAAGRDLNTDLTRRMAELDPDDHNGQVRILEGIKRSNFDAAMDTSHDQELSEAKDAWARAHGYRDWESFSRAVRRASGEEAMRLRRLRGRALRKIKDDINYDERRDAREDAAGRWYRAETRLGEIRIKANDVRRQAAIELLRSVRDDGVGEVDIDWVDRDTGKPLTNRHRLVKAMRFAQAAYPNDWLRRFRDYQGGRKWRLGEEKRGNFNEWSGVVNLSDKDQKTTDGGTRGDVATHEMGHGMEAAVPGLLAAQLMFLWDRTSNGPVGSRTRDTKEDIYGNGEEYGYRDDFPLHYTGKDYVDSANNPTAFELFTTSVESMFAGSEYLDNDMRDWLLGVMALL